MDKGIKIIFAFAVGAAAGSVITWKLVKTKYEQLAQEEIDSVKETYGRLHAEDGERQGEDMLRPVELDEEEGREYKNILVNYNKEGGSKDMPIGTPPYVVSPDEFGNIEEYDAYGLTYYSDGVLTDDGDEPIDDVAGLVGADFASHFGEYEEDSVHVRNERLKADFEILRDYREYSEIRDSKLNPTDDE